MVEGSVAHMKSVSSSFSRASNSMAARVRLCCSMLVANCIALRKALEEMYLVMINLGL